MLLQIQENLEERIVRTLAEFPNSTAEFLQNTIGKRYFSYSIQAIYKELRKLQASGVVVKVKFHYSLRLTWVQEFRDLFLRIQDSYIENLPRTNQMPKEGEKLNWHFLNLMKVDDFTVQLIFSLFQSTTKKVMYEWTCHPWFQLLQGDKEAQFIKTMKTAGYQLYCLIGGNTPLDSLYHKAYDKKFIKLIYAGTTFENINKHLFLIDDYILTAKLPKSISGSIDKLYQSTTSINTLDPKKLLSTFSQPGKFRITLECNQLKAKKLRRKFKKNIALSMN